MDDTNTNDTDNTDAIANANDDDNGNVGESSANVGELGNVTLDDNQPIDPATIKRGRGRPRKLDGTADGQKPINGKSARAKFEREANDKIHKQKSPTNLDVTSLANKLGFFHSILAKLLKNPLLELGEKECLDLAKALKEVAKHHQINVDPKYLAYGELMMVAGVIYTPRVLLTIQVKSAAKKQAQSEQPLNNVTNISSINITQPSSNGRMNYG